MERYATPATPTRKKGKWIVKENIHGLEKFYECSNCGNHCLYEYVEIGFKNAKTKYCPNCGAEMETKENDK
jgi:transcription elongation factor Elf1